MTAALQDHSFAGGRATDTLHDAFCSRRRLPQHIPGRAAVDEIMKTGGWKTESTVQQKIWATCSVQVGRKRKCSQRDAADSELLLPHVREVIEAILRTFG